jgi:hypothetical protein
MQLYKKIDNTIRKRKIFAVSNIALFRLSGFRQRSTSNLSVLIPGALHNNELTPITILAFTIYLRASLRMEMDCFKWKRNIFFAKRVRESRRARFKNKRFGRRSHLWYRGPASSSSSSRWSVRPRSCGNGGSGRTGRRLPWRGRSSRCGCSAWAAR